MQKHNFIFIIFLALISTQVVFSQITNSGFENWSFINGCEEPDGFYYTNNSIGNYPIAKTEDSHSGNYAMKISSIAQGIEGFVSGQARMMFYPIISGGVAIYVKCDSISGSGFGKISLYAYKNGMDQAYGYWETLEEISEYTRIEIPITPIGFYDSIHVIFTAFIANTPLGQETGFFSFTVDDMSEFSPQNGIYNTASNENNVSIFPNPTNNSITVEHGLNANSTTTLELFDITGRILKNHTINKEFNSKTSTTISLIDLPNGIYILNLKNGKDFISTRVEKIE